MRYSIFPVRHYPIYKQYKKQESHMWTTSVADLFRDKEHWAQTDALVQDTYIKTFAIFNVQDTVVNDNNDDICVDAKSIIDNINTSVIANLKHDGYDVATDKRYKDVQAGDVPMVPKAMSIYNNYMKTNKLELLDEHDLLEFENYIKIASAIEVVHQECYSTIIDELIPNAEKRESILDSARTFPFIQHKIEVLRKFSNIKNQIAFKMIANACAELIGFSSLFPMVIFLKTKSKFQGITYMNEEIIMDESIHGESWSVIYKYLVQQGYIEPLDKDTIRSIITEFSDAEVGYVDYMISEESEKHSFFENIITRSNLKDYVRCMSDLTLNMFDIEAQYKPKNPFVFMDMTSFITKSNFHEKKVQEYRTNVRKSDIDVNPLKMLDITV